MQASAIKALMAEIAPVIRDFVQASVEPIASENGRLRAENGNLLRRLEALEVIDVKAMVDATAASMIADQVKAAVSALPAAKDGTSVTVDDVAPMIAECVKKEVAALPTPKDGIDGQDGKDGRDGVDGKDGAGIADLVIDRDGNLIASFTDGRMKHLGQVVGKDGRDGGDGKDGIPFGVDDLDMTLMEDGRTLRMSFTKGDTEYAFQIPFPVVIDRGVFADGKSYEEGDGVTWGGSFWIAQRATGAKPDSADSGWRLAVKRGRDGKDKA